MNPATRSLIHSLRSDHYPTPDYRICHTPGDVFDYSWATDGNAPLAIDTESLPDGSPYCVTFSHTPGTGRLVYTHDQTSMTSVREYFNTKDLHLFHNYLHDIRIMDELAIPIRNFLDTMVMAYELCLGGGGDDEDGMAGRGSLGLKQLAYRHLNMRMTSFQDTVYPHSIPKLHAYLRELLPLIEYPDFPPTCVCGHYQHRHEPRGKTQRHSGRCSGCVESRMSVNVCPKYVAREVPKKTEEDKLLALLSRKVTTLLNDTNPDTDPWKRINDWHDHDKDYLKTILGPWLLPSIADVPKEELVWYACRDSDACLRLYYYLESLTAGGKTGPWLFY